MAALNYAVQYAQALAQAYPYVLHFAALRSTENDSRYRWVGANTIKVPTMTTTGRVNGNRDSIAGIARNYDNAWENKQLKFFRKWGTLIHPMDIDETNFVATVQNITQTFNETQKFPEMDAYLISKLYADWVTAGGTVDTTVLTAANVLVKYDEFMQAMDEARVPGSGRILYVTPAVNTLIKDAALNVRRIMNGDENLNRNVRSLDEVQIEIVPSDLMKTVYNFTTGWQAGTGAKQINMLLVHPSAVITPEKYEFAQLDEPSAGSEGKWVYYEESYSDVFILNQRKGALQFNTAP